MLAWTVLIYSVVLDESPLRGPGMFVAGRAVVGSSASAASGPSGTACSPSRSRRPARRWAAARSRASRWASRWPPSSATSSCRESAGASSSWGPASPRSSRSPRDARCTCRTNRRQNGAAAPARFRRHRPASRGGLAARCVQARHVLDLLHLAAFVPPPRDASDVARSLTWMLMAQVGQLGRPNSAPSRTASGGARRSPPSRW